MPVDFSPVKMLLSLKPKKSEAKKVAATLKENKVTKTGSTVKLTAGLTGLAALGATAVLMGNNKNCKLKNTVIGALGHLLERKGSSVPPNKHLPSGSLSRVKKPFIFPSGSGNAPVKIVIFKNGVLKTDKDTLFSGVLVYRLPDSSKVSITFLDGLMEKSQKEDVNGAIEFVKTYTRKTTQDGRQILKVKMTDSTPVERFFIKTVSPKSDSVTTIYSRAQKRDGIKVQNLILSDTKDNLVLLDGTKEGKARIVEIDKKTNVKNVVEKDESFALRSLGARNGVECFTIENQFAK